MNKFLVFACVLFVAVAAQNYEEDEAAKAAREQQENLDAKYDFGSKVDDQISDGGIERKETREDGKVVGYYRYSDGYVRRTVHYEADENGYRVVKEETEDIGDGPKFNPDGEADVQGSLIGHYRIKLDKSDNEKHYKDVNA